VNVFQNGRLLAANTDEGNRETSSAKVIVLLLTVDRMFRMGNRCPLQNVANQVKGKLVTIVAFPMKTE